MAELSSTSRNKKQTPRVDLTAMVDLAFLLITFFMLTTSLSKPVAMDIVKPDKIDDTNFLDLAASRSMTILLGKNNRVAWYMGVAGTSQPVIEDYHQIGQSIRKNQRLVAAANGNNPKKSLIVIIKPTSGASYKNFVDIMDELNIAQITTAPAIDDEHMIDAEKKFMKQNRIL